MSNRVKMPHTRARAEYSTKPFCLDQRRLRICAGGDQGRPYRDGNVRREHAIALHGSRGRVQFEASHPAHFLILSGAEIHESVVTHGPFIMNDASQIKDALARYHAGRMGQLEFSEI